MPHPLRIHAVLLFPSLGMILQSSALPAVPESSAAAMRRPWLGPSKPHSGIQKQGAAKERKSFY